ncbi:hypothetical protein [Pseudactinotalea sp.]|uniref:hypothetical protein n=1 Tax=Pseudactinotalea sp. TaxID=1926260 RepID=UPI003B3B3AAA
MDVLLEADLPVEKFDRAIDLVWEAAHARPTGDRSVQRAERAWLAELLEVDPG